MINKIKIMYIKFHLKYNGALSSSERIALGIELLTLEMKNR